MFHKDLDTKLKQSKKKVVLPRMSYGCET